jgi:hypothetical protein
MEIVLKNINNEDKPYEFFKNIINSDIYEKWNQPIISIKPILSPCELIPINLSPCELIPINLSPCELIAYKMNIYCDNEIIIHKIMSFLEKKIISKLFTAKKLSKIVENLTNNKWNIDTCQLISYLLDMKFNYRNDIIQFKHYGNTSNTYDIKNKK